MADGGPHSRECATADGGDCHCECAGTQHGIASMPGHKPGGRHGAGVTITPVRSGGKVTHYRVVNDRTGLPPGGGTREERATRRAAAVTVTATSKRQVTLPPPIVEHARKVRESLPKDQAGWDDLTPRGQSARDYLDARAADYEQRVEMWRQRRQATIDTIDAHMRADGMTAAQRKREIDKGIRKGMWLDIVNADRAIADWEADVAKVREQAKTASTERPFILRRDANGNTMPTEALNAHLDAVLDVGRQAMAELRGKFDRDPDLAAARQRLDDRKAAFNRYIREAAGLDETAKAALKAKIVPPGSFDDDRKAIARRESQIIREALAAARPFGGVTHRDVTPASGARDDWRRRLDVAEGYYPTAWLERSASSPLAVTSSRRAYYSHGSNLLAMRTGGGVTNSSAYDDYVDEVTVHELGHRMERMVPGLTALEFAYVRRRSTGPDGNLEPAAKLSTLESSKGYDDHEIAYPDEWSIPYAGKTYEGGRGGPDTTAWEVFQVGTQDLFGRSDSERFDRTGDLDAFTLGALLTLG